MKKPVFKEKICSQCGKSYTPTGPCQKRCPACMAVNTLVRNPAEQKSALAPKPATGSDNSLVLSVLVATGVVSQQVVDNVKQALRQ